MLPSKIREKHGTGLLIHFRAQAIRIYLVSRGSWWRPRRKRISRIPPRGGAALPSGDDEEGRLHVTGWIEMTNLLDLTLTTDAKTEYSSLQVQRFKLK